KGITCWHHDIQVHYGHKHCSRFARALRTGSFPNLKSTQRDLGLARSSGRRSDGIYIPWRFQASLLVVKGSPVGLGGISGASTKVALSETEARCSCSSPTVCGKLRHTLLVPKRSIGVQGGMSATFSRRRWVLLEGFP